MPFSASVNTQKFEHAIAVIPSAGEPHSTWIGASSATCDAMLPIAGKPAIYWTLQELLEVGFKRVAIVVRKRDNELERFVRLRFGGRLDCRFVEPDRNLGVGYSVALGARAFDGTPPLLVVLGDTIARLKEHWSAFERSTVFLGTVNDSERWCMAWLKEDKVLKLVNKVSGISDTSFALSGIYYFQEGRHAFESVVADLVRQARRIEMSDLLAPLIALGWLHGYTKAPWLDVGNPDHVYEAQAQLLQSRAFNSVSLDSVRGSITKRSTYEQKFYDEINYYRLLPEHLGIYFPRVVSSNVAPGSLELTLEFYAYPTFSDLYLFADVGESLWERLFVQLASVCADFTKDDYGSGDELAQEMFVTKNISRLEQFLKEPPAGVTPLFADALRINGKKVLSLRQAAERSIPALRSLCRNSRLTVIHGDLCFSNILCEPMRGLIKLIDPRGSFGRPGLLGDFRYDIAKLAHSALGMYDYIINDLYEWTAPAGGEVALTFPASERLDRVQKRFRSTFFQQHDEKEIKLITAWLFLSMLPLHSDSPRRQVALATRGLELLSECDL